jgi:chromosome partitioning protein
VRIALLNNKGGVGKTFVTILIAEAIARRGGRVLVVSMDPQANVDRRLGVVLDRIDPATLTECLRVGVRNGDASNYVHPCGWSGDLAGRVDVLPADLDLEDRALEAGQPGAINRLRRALYGVDDAYDVTLIDCPPSIKGHLTTMAIAALDADDDKIVCPITPEFDAIAGAQRAARYVEEWGDDLDVRARVAGLVVNGVRGNTALHMTRIEQLAESFPGVPVLGSPIPLRARVAALMDSARPISGSSDPDAAAVGSIGTAIAEQLVPVRAGAA